MIDIEFANYYNELKDSLYDKLMSSGSPRALKRFNHSLEVSKMAGRLAKHDYPNDVNIYQRAILTGLIHDYAKFETKEKYLEMIEKYHLNIEYHEDSKKVYHGSIGYLIVMEELGITDDEILKAIAYHTTGNSEMTFLQEIIYLSDFIEETREGDQYALVRDVAFKDFKKAIAMEAYDVFSYLVNKKVYINPESLGCYNAYIKYLKKEE